MNDLDKIINQKDVNALKALIDENPGIESEPLSWGCSLLSVALEIDAIEMIELLLRRGADPNQVYTRRSPIRSNDIRKEVALCKVHSVEALTIMVNHGALLNVPELTHSIVFCTLCIGRPDIAEKLVEYGAPLREPEILKLKEQFTEEIEFRKSQGNNQNRVQQLNEVIQFCNKYMA